LTWGALPAIAAWILVRKAEPNFHPFQFTPAVEGDRFLLLFLRLSALVTQTALAFVRPSFSTIDITLP
jgi:hypothetical protein